MGVVYDNGCEAISEILIIVLVGVDELEMKAVSQFPNPVQNKLNIVSDNLNLAKVLIVDALGRIVFDDVIENMNVILDLSMLNSGMYYLVVPELDLREGISVR